MRSPGVCAGVCLSDPLSRVYPKILLLPNRKSLLRTALREKPRLAHSRPRAVSSQGENSVISSMCAPDTNRPTFDPDLDIATVVFSHVQCVKTRLNLALVSKLWREASKPAAAYPLWFDFDAFRHHEDEDITRLPRIVGLLDNDEACLYPTRESLDFLVRAARLRMQLRCSAGECKTAEVGASEQPYLGYAHVRMSQPIMDTLPALQYLHENGCPWNLTCYYAAITNTGTVCSTRWITSARGGRNTPRSTRSTSDEIRLRITHRTQRRRIFHSGQAVQL